MLHMSPDDLLNASEIRLQRLATTASPDDLRNLFSDIWKTVRPLYAGQPKSIEAVRGLSLAQAALKVASHADDRNLLIEAWHMMGRSLAANEEFEKAIPFYQQVISSLEDIGDRQQAARLRLALIAVLLNADRYKKAFEVAAVAEGLFKSVLLSCKSEIP